MVSNCENQGKMTVEGKNITRAVQYNVFDYQLGTQKTVSLYFEEDYSRNGRQRNFKTAFQYAKGDYIISKGGP